jgi:hypothetical protein
MEMAPIISFKNFASAIFALNILKSPLAFMLSYLSFKLFDSLSNHKRRGCFVVK